MNVKRPVIVERELKSSLVNFRVSDAERDAIEKKAKKYTNGKVSKWLRYAAMNFEAPIPKGK